MTRFRAYRLMLAFATAVAVSAAAARPAAADYNTNGDTDGRDFLIWQRSPASDLPAPPKLATPPANPGPRFTGGPPAAPTGPAVIVIFPSSPTKAKPLKTK